MRMRLFAFLLLVGGCSDPSELQLKYMLVSLAPTDVYRVETLVAVDPADGRNFFTDSPFRTVAPGIGYEVRDFDGSGIRRLLITHDLALGYTFTDHFVFTLLPPSSGAPPPLIVIARATGMTDRIGASASLKGSFGPAHSLAVPIMDSRCNGAVCGNGQTCCKGACTDLDGDPANCGACEQACGDSADSCVSGSCHCGSGSACSSGQTCCSGLGCVDLTTSRFNCGACGHACNPGESCEGGQCKCAGGPACADGGLCCASGCSTNGSCPCGTMDCPSPDVCCDAASSSCIDVRSSAQNCGACNVTCASPLSCQNGACTCQGQLCGAGDTCCNSGCANTMNDPSNCGSCGSACADGETCVAGTCKCGNTQCGAGQSCCAGVCVGVMTDSMNCGGCGILCNPGESCMNGACVCPGTDPMRACTSPPESCCAPSSLDSGGCFDVSSSHDHCGACGIGCRSNEECQSGKCVATSCNPVCTNKNMCVMGQCRCNSSGPCQDPQSCCSTGCQDLHQDRNNCGNCGVTCSDAQLCCNSGCVTRDATHCQSCGQGCAQVSGRSSFCCGSNDNFTCVVESALNCGGCGKMCAQGQICCPGTSPAGGTSNTSGSTCKQESDFACGPSCTNCNAAGQTCCNHQCCSGNCCNGQCCNGACLLGACVL